MFDDEINASTTWGYATMDEEAPLHLLGEDTNRLPRGAIQA